MRIQAYLTAVAVNLKRLVAALYAFISAGIPKRLERGTVLVAADFFNDPLIHPM